MLTSLQNCLCPACCFLAFLFVGLIWGLLTYFLHFFLFMYRDIHHQHWHTSTTSTDILFSSPSSSPQLLLHWLTSHHCIWLASSLINTTSVPTILTTFIVLFVFPCCISLPLFSIKFLCITTDYYSYDYCNCHWHHHWLFCLLHYYLPADQLKAGFPSLTFVCCSLTLPWD